MLIWWIHNENQGGVWRKLFTWASGCTGHGRGLKNEDIVGITWDLGLQTPYTHHKTRHLITEDSPNDEAYQKFWCSDKNNQIQDALRARSISYNIDWNQKHGAQLLCGVDMPSKLHRKDMKRLDFSAKTRSSTCFLPGFQSTPAGNPEKWLLPTPALHCSSFAVESCGARPADLGRWGRSDPVGDEISPVDVEN